MSSRIIRAGDRIKNLKIQPVVSVVTADKDEYARGFADGQRFGIELALEVALKRMNIPDEADSQQATIPTLPSHQFE